MNKLINDMLSAYARAGLKERELTRMTLIIAQNFINQIAAAGVGN